MSIKHLTSRRGIWLFWLRMHSLESLPQRRAWGSLENRHWQLFTPNREAQPSLRDR